MRSVWKGHIRFSLVSIPVAIYNATDRGNAVSFRQLHKKDNGRIGYVKRCKVCDEEVSKSDIVKGYEYESDAYVLVEPEELENLQLKSTKIIDIEAFVDQDEVHPSLFDKPYYAGPNGDVALQPYHLLRETLVKTKKFGVGRVVIRERENVVLVAPYKRGLIIYELRYDEELRDINKVPDLDEVQVEAKQIELAETLMKTMEKPMADIELKDRYYDSVRALIDAKVAGREVITVAEEDDATPMVDIMDALKQSIELTKA